MNHTNIRTIFAFAFSSQLVLSACGSSSTNNIDGESNIVGESATTMSSDRIAMSQVGFLPDSEKVALIPDVPVSQFQIFSIAEGEVVFEGELTDAKEWQVAKGESYKVADFSALNSTGELILRIDGVEDKAFQINQNAYDKLHDASLKSFYFNRASTDITEEYGGAWARAAGHLDEKVNYHASALKGSTNKDSSNSKDRLFIASKGWYDAGDYGKYVVNSGIATYTLLAAFQHHPNFYQNRNINIPESDNGIPDLLDEINWNLEWLEKMQADDGSVYHKLTTLKWPGKEMPHQDKRARYVIGKSTSAALDFAAVMAMASRVYGHQSDTYLTKSQQWLKQATRAYQWAKANSDLPYVQPDDVKSGEYGDDFFHDEFSWAAAELFLATNDTRYLDDFAQYQQPFTVPSWQHVSALGVISLLAAETNTLDEALYQQLRKTLLDTADVYVSQYQESAFRVPMVADDFVWGSNSAALNKAIVLMQAYRLTGNAEYKTVASSLMTYVLGKNPTGYSFVTGFGEKPAMLPHHRASQSDRVTRPIPGMLVGGPQNGQQDGCDYPSGEPALSYADTWCSYSTNEVAINWNAPLVYVLASLIAD